MAASRQSCLFILSTAKEGVSAASFIQSFTLTHVAFAVQIATPGGKLPEFVNQDEQSRRWLSDFKAKALGVPISLQSVDANRYACMVIPHSPGALVDLANDSYLAHVLQHFIREKKPICGIGSGVAALFSAIDVDHSSTWSFRRYCMTAISVFELAKNVDFAKLPIIPEDIIKDRGAFYSNSEPDATHVVVDRHLITGQNEQSTISAVQNLILMCNQRKLPTKDQIRDNP
ncbi:Glutamine amidotransferase-like class 1 domain-containing protein 1 [Chamberlinius hualienensis]